MRNTWSKKVKKEKDRVAFQDLRVGTVNLIKMFAVSVEFNGVGGNVKAQLMQDALRRVLVDVFASKI